MRLLAQLVGVLLLLGFVGAYFWPIVAALMTASGSTPRGITTLPGQRPTGEPGWTRSDAVEAFRLAQDKSNGVFRVVVEPS